MGTNLLIVMPGSTTSGGARGGFGIAATLTWDDLKAIQTEVPPVQRRGAVAALRRAVVVSEEQNWTTSVTGTTPEYFDIRNWPMAQRRAASREPTSTPAPRSSSSARRWSTSSTARTRTRSARRCASATCRSRSSASLGAKGQSPNGQDYDDTAFIPVTTFRAKIQGGLGKYLSGTIFVAGRRPRTTTRARRQDVTRAPPRAPPHRARRRRRLLDPQPRRDRRRAAGGHRDDDHAARERRRGVAARRRHRHHEHHAGERHRADARDRHAHGGRREAARHPHAVPRRGARRSRVAGGLIGVALGVGVAHAGSRRSSAGRC